MTILRSLIVLVGFIGLAMIWGSGVDLVYSRTGFGMILLGGALGLGALALLLGRQTESRDWVALICVTGSAYFVWRALSGGPIGLAVPDVVQVLLFVGVYCAVVVSDARSKRGLMAVLGIVCVVQLGVAIAQVAQGNSFYVWKENPEKLGSTTGLFGHYNPFAAFMNGSVFFFLSYVCLGKKGAWRVVCALLVVGLLAGLVMSGSRGGWVSLIPGFVVWMLLLLVLLRQRKSKVFGPVLLLGAAISVIGIGTSVWAVQKITEKRVEEISKEVNWKVDTKVRDGGRLAMQQIAFEIFLDSPATGQGPRSFSYLSLENWDPDELQLWMGNLDFAHNEYLQVLSDYGAVGFLIILGLLLIHGVLGAYGVVWDGQASGKEMAIWQLGAVGGLAAILAQCFFSFLIHVPSLICLVAIQLGILAGARGGKVGSGSAISGKVLALVMVGVSVALVILGWRFSGSFLNREKALKDLPIVGTEIGMNSALKELRQAGDAAWDFPAFERAGQEAMRFAMKADESKQLDVARRLREQARDLFGEALKLNPYSPVALCGLPQVDDALGNFEEADRGHQLAMKRMWSREYHLRPHFHAARSAYTRGYYAYQSGDRGNADGYYRVALARLEKRREILEQFRELEETKQLRLVVEAWIAFFEGENLYKEGDRVWKEARPRDPERAHAFMLAAMQRYEKSRQVLEPVDSRWRAQWEQLRKNLEIFKMGRIAPAELTPGEIESIANPEAGLDSSAENR